MRCPPVLQRLKCLLFYLLSEVSMMAAQEYDGMKDQLDLEQSLRVKAETYAHEVISDEGLRCDVGRAVRRELWIA